MALPEDPGLRWPPATLDMYLARVAEHDAWYSGDPLKLAEQYRQSSTSRHLSVTTDANQGKFWRRRSDDVPAKPRNQVHVPMASDVAATSADLLFGSPPRLTADADDDTAGDALEAIVAAGMFNELLEGAEVASALGAVYLRPAWDATLEPWPFLTTVHPDAAVPTWRNGHLAAVVFWTQLGWDGKGILRHLESHDMVDGRWIITHGLYVGDETEVGARLPLDRHPATADLEDTISTGLPSLGVAYVPNMRPNRRMRHSRHGRSDIDGAEDLLDGLDQTYTSWLRDIRLGQARLLVPEDYLEHRGAGKGQVFDVDRELFTPLAVPTSQMGEMRIQAEQFAIRTAEHQDTALALVERIVDNAGYAPQDFGLHIEGRAESGTALNVRRQRSVYTTARKQRYWEPALRTAVAALIGLANTQLGQPVPPQPAVGVAWSEEQDAAETAATVELLNRAQAASLQVRVRMVHPDWTDQQVDDEVRRLQEEQGLAVPSPEQVGALP